MPPLKAFITCWELCDLYAADNRALSFTLKISYCFHLLDICILILQVFWKLDQDFSFSKFVLDFMIISELTFSCD